MVALGWGRKGKEDGLGEKLIWVSGGEEEEKVIQHVIKNRKEAVGVRGGQDNGDPLGGLRGKEGKRTDGVFQNVCKQMGAKKNRAERKTSTTGDERLVGVT